MIACPVTAVIVFQGDPTPDPTPTPPSKVTLPLTLPTPTPNVFQVSERVSGPAGSLGLVAVVMLLLPTAALLVSSRKLRGASQVYPHPRPRLNPNPNPSPIALALALP